MTTTILYTKEVMEKTPVDSYSCTKTPSLCEVLSGSSAAPWNLDALRKYATSQFCAEVLDFYMDAYLYRRAYNEYKLLPPCHEKEAEIRDQWCRIMELYIQSNSAREINIPGTMRRTLVTASEASTGLKNPEFLMPAFNHMEEVMTGIFLQWASTVSSATPTLDLGACRPLSVPYNKISASSDDELVDFSKAYKSAHDLWGYRVYKKIRGVRRVKTCEDEIVLTKNRWG